MLWNISWCSSAAGFRKMNYSWVFLLGLKCKTHSFRCLASLSHSACVGITGVWVWFLALPRFCFAFVFSSEEGVIAQQTPWLSVVKEPRWRGEAALDLNYLLLMTKISGAGLVCVPSAICSDRSRGQHRFHQKIVLWQPPEHIVKGEMHHLQVLHDDDNPNNVFHLHGLMQMAEHFSYAFFH